MKKRLGCLALFVVALIPGWLGAGGVEPGSRATARAITVPSHDIELVSQVDGVIKRILAEEGDRVVEGQPLIELDTELRQAVLAISEEKAKSKARVEL